MSKQLEELTEQLAYVQHRIRWIEGELRGDEIPLGIPEKVLKDDLRNLQDEERRLVTLITAVEDCEHSEVEDTGGPDGSQICLECGKVR
ncbi:hypothetical protein QF038_001807 [Pseudarthrobacter sp. W1I19]|uniref:hypothetical protein n=1 Tax=Pseudarthrobacter sp. W1I19 TaxID=3042288 RepID=UPI00277FE8C4|nr:hypothetical protein [Pseudarthrobacter sp. W1I19]MDQ0923299.1 hypothetical protein [Pseudarthrobacter sp. W1I19]